MDIVRKNLDILTKKLETNVDAITKIVGHLAEDVQKNKELSNKGEEAHVLNDLDILNNLIKFPITSKIILKNNDLFNNIVGLYEKPNKSPEVTLATAKLINSLTNNSSNVPTIIKANPKLANDLLTNLNTEKKLDTDVEKAIQNNEVGAFANLVSDNYKDLLDNKILEEKDLQAVCKLHSSNPEHGEKLQNVLETLNQMNEEQQKQNKFKKDVYDT